VVGLDRNWAYNPACKMARPWTATCRSLFILICSWTVHGPKVSLPWNLWA